MNIKEIVEQNGIENVFILDKAKPLRNMLFLSYTSSDDESVDMLFKIKEFRFNKIYLNAITEGYANENWYVSDLESSIRKGTIKVLINKNNE